MYRRMDCDNTHFEYCLSPELFPVTLVRFLSLLSTNISTSVLQNMSPSFNIIALSEVIVNFTSHLCNVIQDLLWLSYQPASVQSLNLSSPRSYVAAYKQEYHMTDTGGLIACELIVHFSRMACKKSFDFSRLRAGVITAGKHSSLLSFHPNTHILQLGLSWRKSWLK